MKKVIAILMLIMMTVLMIGCSQPTGASKALAAEEYVSKLKEVSLAIGETIVYTAETDSNNLLGRPNQYTSKVNFADTTLEQFESDDPQGGSVEVFNNGADAKKRKEYIDSIGKESPMFIEYSYINGGTLLRLNKALTPEQAKKYETEFMKIN